MPEPNRSAPGPQIAPLVARGLSSFKALISALEDNPIQCSTAASHLARFKLWAGSLGAHRPSGSRSLEYRLRDASFIRNHIISLLHDLCSSIDKGTSTARGESFRDAQGEDYDSTEAELAKYFQDDAASEKSETDRILDDIGHVIDCLLRLSVTLSNPAPHDQFKSRAGADSIEQYEEWDTKHVREKFADVDTKIAERLGKAMAQRRQYFKYREKHINRLAEGLDGDGLGVEADLGEDGERATTVASSLPDHLKESRGGTESTMNEFAGWDDSRSEMSGTSYAPSTINSDQLRVPPMPKEYIDGPFKCPFCHMIVSIDTRHAWKKHVFRDLRPYVCLSETCPTPGQQYLRRSEWAKHMRQEHWKTWQCSFGCPEAFDTADGFRNHTKATHGQDVSPDNLDTLESLSSCSDLTKAQGKCPLCIDQVKSDKKYASHVGEHLECLALFTLPKTGDEDGEGDDEEDDESKEGVHGHDDDSEGHSDGDSVEGGETEEQPGETDDEAEAEAQRKAEEVERQKEIEAQARKDSQEAFQQRMEDIRIAKEEALKQIEQAKIEAEEAAREQVAAERKAYEEERALKHAEAMRKAEEEARLKFELEINALKERKKAEELERTRAEEETRLKFEAEMRAAEERRKREVEERARAEEEARLKWAAEIKAVEERKRRKEEEGARAERESRLKYEAEVRAAGDSVTQEHLEAKYKAAEERRKKEEEERARAEEMARIRLEAALKAEAEAKAEAARKAQEEAARLKKLEEEAKAKAEAEALAKVEEEKHAAAAAAEAAAEAKAEAEALKKKYLEEARLKAAEEKGE